MFKLEKWPLIFIACLQMGVNAMEIVRARMVEKSVLRGSRRKSGARKVKGKRRGPGS